MEHSADWTVVEEDQVPKTELLWVKEALDSNLDCKAPSLRPLSLHPRCHLACSNHGVRSSRAEERHEWCVYLSEFHWPDLHAHKRFQEGLPWWHSG